MKARKENRRMKWCGETFGSFDLASVSLLLIALAALLIMQPQAGFSQTPPTQNVPLTVGGQAMVCQLVAQSVSRNVIQCITDIVNLIADNHINKMTQMLQRYVGVLSMLAIILYGIRLIYGAARIRGESVLLLIKLCLVSYFATSDGLLDLRETIINSSIELGNAFMAMLYLFTAQTDAAAKLGLGSAGNIQTFLILGKPELVLNPIVFNVLTLKLFATGGGAYIANPTIFDVLDKTILTILGVNSSNTGLMAAAWLFIGTFFGGPIGVAVGVFILSIVVALLTACVQIVFIFAMTIIGLTFLLALGPIFIPLVLFSPTKSIFQNWLSWVISLTLQPMVLVIFLVMMLFAIDWVFVQPLKKVYEEAQATLLAPDSKKEQLLIGGLGFKGAYDESNPDPLVAKVPVWGDYYIGTEVTQQGIGQFPLAERHSMKGSNLPLTGYKLEAPTSTPAPLIEQIGGVMSGDIYVPYLDWDAKRLMKVVALLAPGFVLTLLMISFQKMLPAWVSDLVGNRQVASLAGYAQPIEAAGTRAVSWIGNKASWYKGGKR